MKKQIFTLFFTLLLSLVTTKTWAANEVIVQMVTEKAINESFSFQVYVNSSGTTLQVDFGDGNLKSFEDIASYYTITGILQGNTVKVYGTSTDLTFLKVNDLSLTSLDVSNNAKLNYLYCYSNSLTSLDVSNNTELSTLYCYSNSLTSLDLSSNVALIKLYCYSNSLTSLDVSNNTELATLLCYSNSLTSLDLSSNVALNNLYCYSNSLTSLDVSNNTELATLLCYSNSLTSLDVSSNVVLKYLICPSNSLASLNVSNNTELVYLDCHSNSLTSLDVSNNTELEKLFCHSNAFTFSTLPLETFSGFQYSPQDSVPIADTIKVEGTVDLSSESEIDGETTTYVWKTESGNILEAGTDYSINGGVTTFLKGQNEKVYCEMANCFSPLNSQTKI